MSRNSAVLAFTDPYHDSSFCMYGADGVTHIESERFTRKKYETIDPVLVFCEMFPHRVESFQNIAFEESHIAVTPFIKKLLALKPEFGTAAYKHMTQRLPYTHENFDTMDCPAARNDTGAVEAFLQHLSRDDVDIFFCGHHASHAATAFFSSGFEAALTITLDGIGRDYCLEEGGRTFTRARETIRTRSIHGSIVRCRGSTLQLMHHETDCSFGFAWARVTEHVLGLEEGAEGTAMAMAAFGDPKRYRLQLDNNLLWLPAPDGALSEARRSELLAYFATLRAGIRTERDAFDIAAALQHVTEHRLRVYLARFVEPDDRDVCLSGGFFLNCSVVGKLHDWFPQLRRVFVPPAPYDGGISLGAAQLVHHCELRGGGPAWSKGLPPFAMGPRFSRLEVFGACRSARARISEVVPSDVLRVVADGKIIGLFCGSAESGRRALGNRSITADPRRPDIKDRLNRQIKHRQWFRPFAPMVLAEHASEWFECDEAFSSPYMSFAVPVRLHLREYVPAVVHADGSARVQTVHRELTPELHALLTAWHTMSGIPILLNTSFNDREPIVETPADALNTMQRARIDGVYFIDAGVLAEPSE